MLRNLVMAHGDILRNIVDGHQSARVSSSRIGIELRSKMWDNAETKIFTFRSATDPEATLLEIDKVKPETATDEPTSSEMT